MAFKTQYWTVLTCLWFTLTYFTSYIIALSQDHVYPLFPYISDTGTYVPESCVFGQMLNIAALLLFVVMYIRYKMLELRSEFQSNFYKTCNKISHYIAIFGVLGLSIVANFQETNNFAMHMVGASLAFGSGSVYIAIQALLTFYSDVSLTLKGIRLIICVLFIAMYISTLICGSISMKLFDGEKFVYWHKDNAGFDLHLAATFSEWSMALLLNIFILSNYWEFKKIRFEQITFSIINK